MTVCKRCPLYKTTNQVRLKGRGPKNTEVMIVGEAPSQREEKTGKAFVNRSSQLLIELLREIGLDHYYKTYAVSCRPPDDRPPRKKEIVACRYWLNKKIERVKPRFVLLLGNVALQAVLDMNGIKKLRGRPLEKDGVIYLPTFHPSQAIRDPKFRYKFAEDLQLFKEIIEEGEIPREKGLNVVVVNTPKKHQQCLKALHGSIGADLETSGLYAWSRGSCVNAIGLASKKTQWIYLINHPSTGVTFKDLEKQLKKPIQEIIEDLDERMVECRIVGQNWKFDHLWMRVHYDVRWYAEFDTMLAHFLLDENSRHDLKSLSARFLGAREYDISLKEKLGLEGKVEDFIEYLAKDAYYTRKLKFTFKKMLFKEGNVDRVFRKIMMPCENLFCNIEFQGVYVDQDQMKVVETKLRRELAATEEKLLKYGDINWGSPAQLAKLLFEDLKIPIVEKTAKGNPSTKESVLLQIDHPVVHSVLEWRGASTQLSTFIEGWKPYLHLGRLHPSFKLHGTVTGRLSCTHPNLQQVPRDPTIRSLLIAPKGWTFIEVDLSQIELRIAAILSGDRAMIEAFRNGVDIHWLTALRELKRGKGLAKLVLSTGRELAGKKVSYDESIDLLLKAGLDKALDIDEAWKEIRKKAKAINFGYLYGMGWRGFKIYARDKYGIKDLSDRAAQDSRVYYFKTYEDLPLWHTRQRRYAKLNGHVLTMTGRKRRLPAATLNYDCPERAQAERQAINSPVQSFANELNLMTLIEVCKTCNPDYVRPVGTVHDSILMEVRDDKVRESVEGILEIASSPSLLKDFNIKLNIPILADAAIGPWGKGVSLERWQEPLK